MGKKHQVPSLSTRAIVRYSQPNDVLAFLKQSQHQISHNIMKQDQSKKKIEEQTKP